MATSDNVGEFVSSEQRVYRVELTGREFAILFWGTRYLEAERLEPLAKAIAEGDRASQGEILRGWGIRRSELASTFSRRVIRVSDVLQREDIAAPSVQSAFVE